MPTEHTVRSYDEELRRLANTLTQMGGLAESQIAAAMQAVARRDGNLAAEIVSTDPRVDLLEADVERQVVRMLALRQPWADAIVLSLRIASDLERTPTMPPTSPSARCANQSPRSVLPSPSRAWARSPRR
jgi:phosphate transport system protein